MRFIEANGAAIPAIGLGTWTLDGRQCTEIVAAGIEAGYRHIDTAAMYENEQAVGEGIRASGVDRKQLFLTSKVWHTDLADGDLQASAAASVQRLGVDAVDLLLIHWPPGADGPPVAEAIRALNDARRQGLARHVGVSNFTTAQLAEAVEASEAPLVCNQCEYHPWLNQDAVLAACRSNGMAFVSYCPLGRAGELFEEEAIRQASRAHGRTAAQIVLRWHLQQTGIAAIPRTSRRQRLRENLAVFDFALSNEEMRAISALRSRGHRICDFGFSPHWDKA